MKLYPFQVKAVNWLAARPHAYLAAKMGLGKSGIILRTIEKLDAYPALVICPAIARAHWENEIAKWTPDNRAQVEVVSYEEAVKRSKNKTRPKYETMVFDEGHYVKSATAIRTKLLLLNKNALRTDTNRLYFLSGTPAPNNISELWPALFSIGAVKERFTAFCNRYCEYEKVFIGHNRSVMKISGAFKAKMPELKARCKEHVLQVSYEEARIDLPAVTFEMLPVSGTYYPHERDADQAAERVFNLDLMPGLGHAVDPFTALQALAPSIATLRRMHAARKVKPCAALIAEELELGLYEKVVVFAHHKEAIENLHAALRELKVSSVYVHGGVEHKDRFNRIHQFQTEPRCQVYIGSILASGTAINLHATNQVIFLEQDFVPGNNAQAIARAARIGQKEKTVNVRWLVLNDSGIDSRVAEILMKKTEDLKSFFE